jgi:hypothetical protein
MTVVAHSDWEWSDSLPDGLDEAAAKIYRQTASEDRVQLGGEHCLFEGGQVWWRRDGRWRRSVVSAADLNSDLFEPITG